jgi:hypothetical protein
MISGSAEIIRPQEAGPMAKQHRVLRIDLAKQISHVLGPDATEKIVLRKRLTWQTLLPLVMQLPPVLAGVEVCAAAHSTR